MQLDQARVRRYLRSFDFVPLFIEELGWDHHRSTLTIERCHYLCVFHWKLIKDNQDATKAITAVLGKGIVGAKAEL